MRLVGFLGFKMAAVESFDSLDEPVVLSPKPRKIKRQETNRQKLKKARHSGGGKIPSISCNHDESGVCKVTKFGTLQLLIMDQYDQVSSFRSVL